MVFEILGTNTQTGKRVKAKVHASTREHAIKRLVKRGIRVDPEGGDGTPQQPSIESVLQTTAPKEVPVDPVIIPPPISSAPRDKPPIVVPSPPAAACPPASPFRARSKTNWIARGSGIAALLLALWWLGSRDRGPLAVPARAKTAEELQHERMGHATNAAITELVRIHETHLNPLSHYNDKFASEVLLWYPDVPTEGIDPQLQRWINSMLVAARELTDAENARRSALWDLESGNNRKAYESAKVGAALGAGAGKTTSQKIGGVVVGGITGMFFSAVDTEMQKDDINRRYNELLRRNSSALKEVHERQSDLLARLNAKYD